MDNSHSYDPRMEDLPMVISYPRSGSHWLNSIMELYFDRPRLRPSPTSMLQSDSTDFMWFHDHDRYSKLMLTHQNILYLYRNPSNVIFSILMAERKPVDEAAVEIEIERLRKHHEKYLDKYPSICYEKCKEDLLEEFKIILQFFHINEPVDEKKLLYCNRASQKYKVINKAAFNKAVDKRFLNPGMLSEEYENKRIKFHDSYKKHIDSALKWNKS